MFNSYYINISLTTPGKSQMKLENNLDSKNDFLITTQIIKKHKNHPSPLALSL